MDACAHVPVAVFMMEDVSEEETLGLIVTDGMKVDFCIRFCIKGNRKERENCLRRQEREEAILDKWSNGAFQLITEALHLLWV
mmetsp:Transcript_32295/g.62383  ORF Transcript_32295/g.62383 Transcript_32295/m.62383 type:complete len:83 (-) Transcript_32295:4-252(-)